MFELCHYRLTGEKSTIKNFNESATFWDSYFMDRNTGDTYFSVFTNGTVKDSLKANPYKTSYHSMEHCILNYIYLNAWVNKQPFGLFFSMDPGAEADTLYPVPVEDRNIFIQYAKLNGNIRDDILDPRRHAVFLPGDQKSVVSILFESANFPDNKPRN
jgi:hypothetical protein